MSPRARPFASALIGSVLALAALALCGDALAQQTKEVTAKTHTIEYPPLGFKVAIAVPEEGQLCIIVPESAQETTACLGLDPTAMTEALPQGPERPFGVAYARMGDWSYIVLLAPIGSGIEAKEDIEEFVAAAARPDPDLPDVTPKLVGPSPERTFELVKVKETPVVKFRLDAGVPPTSPTYDVSTMLHYAGFGGKTAMVSFITSPKDVDRVRPFAEATIASLQLPPRDQPERFGKPRAELQVSNTRTAVMILGPLLALGGLLFLWLGRSKKVEDEPDGDGDEGDGGEKEGRGK